MVGHGIWHLELVAGQWYACRGRERLPMSSLMAATVYVHHRVMEYGERWARTRVRHLTAVTNR
jgi:hypothetical protein